MPHLSQKAQHAISCSSRVGCAQAMASQHNVLDIGMKNSGRRVECRDIMFKVSDDEGFSSLSRRCWCLRPLSVLFDGRLAFCLFQVYVMGSQFMFIFTLSFEMSGKTDNISGNISSLCPSSLSQSKRLLLAGESAGWHGAENQPRKTVLGGQPGLPACIACSHALMPSHARIKGRKAFIEARLPWGGIIQRHEEAAHFMPFCSLAAGRAHCQPDRLNMTGLIFTCIFEQPEKECLCQHHCRGAYLSWKSLWLQAW